MTRALDGLEDRDGLCPFCLKQTRGMIPVFRDPYDPNYDTFRCGYCGRQFLAYQIRPNNIIHRAKRWVRKITGDPVLNIKFCGDEEDDR